MRVPKELGPRAMGLSWTGTGNSVRGLEPWLPELYKLLDRSGCLGLGESSVGVWKRCPPLRICAFSSVGLKLFPGILSISSPGDTSRHPFPEARPALIR